MKRKLLLIMTIFGLSMFLISTENAFAQRKAVSGKEVTGTFRMNFKGEFKDFSNEIKILALGSGKVKVQFELIYPSRFGKGKDDVTVNVGNAVGEAKIDGDTAIYSDSDGGKCEIEIKFLKPGRIQVSQTEEGAGCGFGLNVRAEGTYEKVSSARPKFEAVE